MSRASNPPLGQRQQRGSLVPGNLQHRWAKWCIGVMRIEGCQAVWLCAERYHDGSMPAFPSCLREDVAGQARSPWLHLDDTNRRGGTEWAKRPCNSLGIRRAAIEQRETLDAAPFDLNQRCSGDEVAKGHRH
jgi:hypothetical protein